MNLAQYTQMWQWINEWQTKNNTKDLPTYVNVSSFKIEGVEQDRKNNLHGHVSTSGKMTRNT